MGLSRTVSEIDGDLVENRKKNFPPRCIVFCVPAEGVPLELVISAGGTKN